MPAHSTAAAASTYAVAATAASAAGQVPERRSAALFGGGGKVVASGAAWPALHVQSTYAQQQTQAECTGLGGLGRDRVTQASERLTAVAVAGGGARSPATGWLLVTAPQPLRHCVHAVLQAAALGTAVCRVPCTVRTAHALSMRAYLALLACWLAASPSMAPHSRPAPTEMCRSACRWHPPAASSGPAG